MIHFNPGMLAWDRLHGMRGEGGGGRSVWGGGGDEEEETKRGVEE